MDMPTSSFFALSIEKEDHLLSAIRTGVEWHWKKAETEPAIEPGADGGQCADGDGQ